MATLETKVEAVTAPDTPKLVSVPTLVMLGWAAVVTVPAVVALVAAPLKAPTKVVAVIELFDKLAVKPVLVNSVMLPVAAFAKIRKLFPVPAATLIKSATFARETYKLGTTVVDVMISGAVPVAIDETNCPAVVILPPVTLPVATIKPPVPKLPTLALPVATTLPLVVKLPPDTLPVAVIRPAVPKLPTLALPVTVNLPPVEILPPVILPLAVRYPDKLIFATLEIFAGKSTHNV